MNSKVSVVLSVYNPNIIYLKKQLKSLDAQTYNNMEILIFDDCVKNRCDKSIFEECLKNKKYLILPYQDENMGYTKAFEYLVSNSDGKYVAFCDQDDIWKKDKIQKCVSYLEQENKLLVITDIKLIDEKGNVICNSLRHNTKEKWQTNDDIVKYNFFKTYSPGMSIVVDGEFVRSILPFSKFTGHDKYIIAYASLRGGISCLDEPLVEYRRHENNVSKILVGINSKKDYENERVIPCLNLIKDFEKLFPKDKGVKEALEFAYARKKHNIFKLFKYRDLAPNIAKFEIALSIIPNFIFKYFIRLFKYVF